MCGIVGTAGKHSYKELRKMNDTQIHRGPDDSGEYIYQDTDYTLQLAMRRLAILDIHGGCQPMISEDGNFALVFNGEIFNSIQLREELNKKAKIEFKTTHSDTEVLLYSLITWGVDCLSKLNGMFSFAFWNRSRKELICAVDRFGIKPLYFEEQGNRLLFASEIKSLLLTKHEGFSLDTNSIFDFLSLRYVMSDNSIVDGIKRLLPGHLLKWRPHATLSVEPWFKYSIGNCERFRTKGIQDEVLSRFKSAVEKWSISDVPIGCALSGGLDSSAIVGALCSAGKDVSTFSLGFADLQNNKIHELNLALKTAQNWGVEHHEILVNAQDLINDLLLMVWHLDEPYAGGLPSWWVFKEMHKEVKVAMTGVGGDELFGNYGKWWGFESKFSLRPRKRPTSLVEFEESYFDRRLYFSDASKRRFLYNQQNYKFSTSEKMHNLMQHDSVGNSVRDRMTYLDLRTQLPFEFLLMTDRFSMAHSVEARTPFLDNEFSNFVLGINGRIRTRRRDLKYLLRESVSELLIPEVAAGGKKGFDLPIIEWINGPLRTHIRFFLSPKRISDQGIFKPCEVLDLIESHFQGRKNNSKQLWILFMFQLWYFVYIENKGQRPTFTLRDIH